MKYVIFIATLLTCAGARADGPTLPPDWTHHDLSNEPILRASFGGARATLTYVGPRGQAFAPVMIYQSVVLQTPWPDDAAQWTKRLVGHRGVVLLGRARLFRRDGIRMYRVETQSDSDSGRQLYTALMAAEVVRDGQTRLIIFSLEDTRDEFELARRPVRTLFDSIHPLEFKL